MCAQTLEVLTGTLATERAKANGTVKQKSAKVRTHGKRIKWRIDLEEIKIIILYTYQFRYLNFDFCLLIPMATTPIGP